MPETATTDQPAVSIFERPPAPKAPEPTYQVRPVAKARPTWVKEPEPAYRTLGMTDWFEQAAVANGLTDRLMIGKIQPISLVKAVQQQLTHLSAITDPKSQSDAMDLLTLLRTTIKVVLDGVDAAIEDAATTLSLPLPPFLVPPAIPFTVAEPVPLSVDPAPSCQPPTDDPEETTDGPGHLRNAEPDHERGDVRKPSKRRRGQNNRHAVGK